MLILVTGQPGNGKTLRAMALVSEEYERNAAAVKEGKEHPRRFFSNIAGSTTDENPDAFPWLEKLPEHRDWTKLPDGSFVVYDEAHSDGNTPGLERYGRLFPSTGKPGESDDMRIRAMSTHRHRGFDIVLVTQWPNKIHHQVRTLVGKHIHMNRAMGMQRAGVLTWTRVQTDPYDERQREKAEEEIWVYEKALYSRYRSSTIHTATYKFKVPRKVWQGVSMLISVLLVSWLLWLFVFKPDPSDSDADAADKAQVPAPNGAHAPPPLSVDDVVGYVELLQPRVEEMPWSAPVFDDRKATADPQLYCMVSAPGDGGDGTHRENSQCRCVTEQGTVYMLEMQRCLYIARWGGSYNPFRERRERDSQVQQPVQMDIAATPRAAVGIGDPQVPVHPQGAFRGVSTGPESGYQLQGW